jgi:hypothetical protein
LDNKNNYGIVDLTKEKVDQFVLELNNYSLGNWGPVVEKNGKFFFSTLKSGVDINDVYKAQEDPYYDYTKYYEVTKVISKTTDPKEAQEILIDHNYDMKFLPPSKDSPRVKNDSTYINNYISEVEKTIKKEVGRIDMNNDGTIDIYDSDGLLIAKNTKIKENTDSNKSGKFDLTDIEKTMPKEVKVTANDKVTDDNKIILENYLNEITRQKDVDLKLDEDGHYVAVLGDKTIIFDKNTTFSKAINLINEEFKDEKSLKLNKSLASNRVKNAANTQRIFIDVPTFEAAMGKFSSISGLVSDAKNSYKTDCFSGELASHVATLNLAESKNSFDNAANLATSLSTNISYSLQAYENIDHNLGVIINSIINEIFTLNNFIDEKTKEFYQSDLEERKVALQKIIDDLTAQLNNVQKQYGDVATFFNGVGYAFGLLYDVDADKIKTYGYNKMKTPLSVNEINRVFDFIEEHDLIPKLKDYANGKNWKDSGLADVFMDYALNAHADDTLNENQFLMNYLKAQVVGENEVELKNYQSYCSSPAMPWFTNLDSGKAVEHIKEHLKDQINTINVSAKMITGSDDTDISKLTSQELASFYKSEIEADEESLLIIPSQIAGYKKYQLIMPYEADMKGNTYLEYLVHNWGDIDISTTCPELNGKIQYMSQQELALYFMYKGVLPGQNNVKDDKKASGYLSAMDDLINQRHGLEDAIIRINQYNEWSKNGGLGGLSAFLQSGIDGFSDGMEGFFTGIGNVLLADGKRDASDYRNLYMLTLLGNGAQSDDVSGIYSQLGLDEMDPTFKDILKRNYTVLKSVGNMAIPTIASFIPGVGPTMSKVLFGLNSLGSSTESAMQYQMDTSGQTDAATAYTYGTLSALSGVAMNKLMSGITGLNGNLTPPQGVGGFIQSMIKQGGRGVTGSFLDSFYRSTILGQPIDLSHVAADSFDTFINGMLTAGIMNGTTKLAFKLADGLVFRFSDKYNSYSEMMADMQKQFNESKVGQKLLMLKSIGGDKYKQEQMKWDKTIVGKWLNEQNDADGNVILDLTEDAQNVIPNYELKNGQKLMLDTNTNNYYVYDTETGSALTIPNTWLSTHEGSIDSSFLELKRFEKTMGSDATIQSFENGIVTIKTIHGQTLKYRLADLNSGNAIYEIQQKIIDYEQDFATDYQLKLLGENKAFESVANEWLNGMDSDITRQFATTLSNLEPKTANDIVGLLTSKSLLGFYEAAQQDAQNGLEKLSSYRAHTIPHIIDVLSNTIDTAYTISDATGVQLTDADIRELAVEALLHDTGMHTDQQQVHTLIPLQGPVVKDEDPNKGMGYYLNYVVTGVSKDSGNITRENHAFMSGVNAVGFSKELQKYFPELDANKVGLIDFSHSKSNSGVRNLGSKGNWSQAIQSLQKGIDAKGITPDGIDGLTLLKHFQNKGLIGDKIEYDLKGGSWKMEIIDDGKPKKVSQDALIKVYDIDDNFMKELGTKAMTLRLGDANTNNDLINKNQAGQSMSVDPKNVVTNFVDIENGTYDDDGETKPIATLNNLTGQVTYKWSEAAKQELKGSTYNLNGTETSKGAEFVLGENNEIYSTRVHTDTNGVKTLDEVITVKNGNSLPINDINMGLERKGELDTGGTAILTNRRLVFRLPEDTSQEALSYYQKLLNSSDNGLNGTPIVVEYYNGKNVFGKE